MTGALRIDGGELPSTDGVRAPRTRLLSAGRPVAAGAAARRGTTLEIHGAERVPATGPLVMAANHVGWLDGPLLAICSPRPVHALTKQEMFEGPLGSFLLRRGADPAGPLPRRRARDPDRAQGAARRPRRRGLPRGGARAGRHDLARAPGRPTSRWSPVRPSCRCRSWAPGCRAARTAPSRPAGSRIAMTFGEPVQLGQPPVAAHPAAGGRGRSGRHRRRSCRPCATPSRTTGMTLPGPLGPPKREKKRA